MNAGELMEYLKGFAPDSRVAIIAANPKARKKYAGRMCAITDMGQPVLIFDISEESDLDEEEMAEAVQDELNAQREGGAE